MGIFSPRTKVAVLRGGPSSGYDNSLKTGSYLLTLLNAMPDAYEPVDVFISKDGEWHRSGLVENPESILKNVDVVWNAMHGQYGEDGQVQKILESMRTPFVGSGVFPSVLAHNKHLAKDIYRRHSLLTPEFEILNKENLSNEELVRIFRQYLHPVIVKPANGVHSQGIMRAYSFYELKNAVEETLAHTPSVLVEELINGEEVSCVVINEAKGEQLYSLLPVGVRSHSRTGGNFTEQNQRVAEMSKIAHEALSQRHYSSSDFIITPSGKIYILETNSQPVLCENSLMHKALKATGWNPKDFAEHCVKMALQGRG